MSVQCVRPRLGPDHEMAVEVARQVRRDGDDAHAVGVDAVVAGLVVAGVDEALVAGRPLEAQRNDVRGADEVGAVKGTDHELHEDLVALHFALFEAQGHVDVLAPGAGVAFHAVHAQEPGSEGAEALADVFLPLHEALHGLELVGLNGLVAQGRGLVGHLEVVVHHAV